MTGPGHDDGAGDSEDVRASSDRRGWLVATAVAVALILAAGVFLVSRAGDDPGMPGMDMGSEPAEGDDDATSSILTRGDESRVADGVIGRPEVGRR